MNGNQDEDTAVCCFDTKMQFSCSVSTLCKNTILNLWTDFSGGEGRLWQVNATLEAHNTNEAHNNTNSLQPKNPTIPTHQSPQNHKNQCTQQYHWYYTNNNQNPSTFHSLTPLWRPWAWQSVERFLSLRTFVRMACPCPCDQIWCHSCRWEILNLPFDANSCLQINNQHSLYRQWCFLQQERKCDIWNYFSISILCLSLSFINATASQEPGYNRQTQVCLH